MNRVNSNALAETLFIINCLSPDDKNKIDKEFIEFLSNNKNSEYTVNIDPNMDLQNQSLLDDTKALLKEIYLTYFISERERNRILQDDKYLKAVEEDLKSKKYSYDDLFKNRTTKKVTEETEAKVVSLIEYKESIFKKIINKIVNFFKK